MGPNNLANLSPGEMIIRKIPFNILPGQTNDARSCIILGDVKYSEQAVSEVKIPSIRKSADWRSSKRPADVVLPLSLARRW